MSYPPIATSIFTAKPYPYDVQRFTASTSPTFAGLALHVNHTTQLGETPFLCWVVLEIYRVGPIAGEITVVLKSVANSEDPFQLEVSIFGRPSGNHPGWKSTVCLYMCLCVCVFVGRFQDF